MANASILAISGSLRAGSYNSALVRAASKHNPGGADIEIYDGLAGLPMFNQDDDHDAPSPQVADLRRRIAAADGLLIVTPEHNSSIPAALKNAVDWAGTQPGGVVLAGKPVAIAGASPGAFGSVRAQLALRQILTSIGSEVIAKPEVTVFHAHDRFDDAGNLTDQATVARLRDLLTVLIGRSRPA